MTLRFLLDTNLISEPLRRRSKPRLLARLEQHGTKLAIAAPIWHGVWFGCIRRRPSPKRRVIEAYLNEVVAVPLLVLAYDELAAGWHPRERARLAAAGKTPPSVDGQIAAIAVTRELTLVTLNEADYRDFQTLTVINWVESERRPIGPSLAVLVRGWAG